MNGGQQITILYERKGGPGNPMSKKSSNTTVVWCGVGGVGGTDD